MSGTVTYSARLYRYAAGIFLIRFVAILIGLTVVMQMLDLLAQADDIQASATNTSNALQHYIWLRFPQLVDQFAPFVTLLAALLSLARMAQPSEVIVMQAIGLSPKRILMPLLVCALALSVLHVIYRDQIVIPARDKLDAWKRSDFRGLPTSLDERSGPYWFSWQDKHIRIGAVEMDAGNILLRDIKVIYQKPALNAGDFLIAERAQKLTGSIWQLYNVRRYTIRDYVWQQSDQQALALGLSESALLTVKRRLKHLPLKALYERLNDQNNSRDRAEIQQRLWHRVTGPLAHIIMPLIAALVAFGTQRSGQLLIRMVIGLALGFGYFIVENMVIAFGDFGLIPPLIAACGPFLLFLLIGITRLYRATEHAKGRNSSASVAR